MPTSKIIVLEGIDGSGKTTIAKKLKEYLEKEGYKVFYTAEPSENPIGTFIRKILNGEEKIFNEKTLLFLFSADRTEHISYILSLKNSYDYIIIDRFSDSTIAYQTASLGKKYFPLINEMVNFSIQEIYQFINVWILLDIDVETALKRIGKKDLIESKGEEFLRQVREIYLEIFQNKAKREIVYAGKDVESVFQEVMYILKRYSVI